MGWAYHKIFASPNLAQAEDFIFVNTNQLEQYAKIGRSGYHAVGFPVQTRPRDSNITMPIVLDDFTTTSYPFNQFDAMEEIQLADVPAKIKSRFTKWEKFQ